jgi:hypothetical protein
MWTFKTPCYVIFASIILLHFSYPALGQANSPAAQPPSADTAAEQPTLKPAELDALVAPIALYPDTLLANVLMASTYPLEVVKAERWMNENSKLKGDELKAAVEKQSWDSSVKALAAAPSVLQMMSERLDWMEKLGEAFLAQQLDVMDSVQRLRALAYDRKKLSTSEQQVVSVKQEQSRQIISIDPATPDTIYVPYYEPAVVFGDWPYPDYPAYPYYWGYPGYIAAGVIATGIAFGGAYALGRWATGGYWGGDGYWGGSRVNWGGGAIDVNRGGRVEHWAHNPAHRQGARYNNANLQQRFGNANQGRNAARQGTRQGIGNQGQRGDRGARAGADRGGAGRQAGAGRAAAAGNRQARNRPAQGARGAKSNRAAGRPSNRGASRAGNSRPAAGMRHGGGGARFAGGGHRAAAFHGGGGFRGGGGRGGGGRGGGRRSDIRLKHDVALLGWLDDGLGYYRFAYNGSEKTYVGVIAQEVSALRPDAVARDREGYLRVFYNRLGLRFRSYDDWLASGAKLPKVLSSYGARVQPQP